MGFSIKPIVAALLNADFVNIQLKDCPTAAIEAKVAPAISVFPETSGSFCGSKPIPTPTMMRITYPHDQSEIVAPNIQIPASVVRTAAAHSITSRLRVEPIRGKACSMHHPAAPKPIIPARNSLGNWPPSSPCPNRWAQGPSKSTATASRPRLARIGPTLMAAWVAQIAVSENSSVVNRAADKLSYFRYTFRATYLVCSKASAFSLNGLPRNSS